MVEEFMVEKFMVEVHCWRVHYSKAHGWRIHGWRVLGWKVWICKVQFETWGWEVLQAILLSIVISLPSAGMIHWTKWSLFTDVMMNLFTKSMFSLYFQSWPRINIHVTTKYTSLLMQTVAQFTRPSFRPKNNNQPLKKFLSLAGSWVKVVKNWTSF